MTPITLEQYFGIYEDRIEESKKDEILDNSKELLSSVNDFLLFLETERGLTILINPLTNSCISGQKNGGFRPLDCKEGSLHSSHKEVRGIDIYDPFNSIDECITNEDLIKFNLYREHPNATIHWCHLTDRSPPSGRRSFMP